MENEENAENNKDTKRSRLNYLWGAVSGAAVYAVGEYYLNSKVYEPFSPEQVAILLAPYAVVAGAAVTYVMNTVQENPLQVQVKDGISNKKYKLNITTPVKIGLGVTALYLARHVSADYQEYYKKKFTEENKQKKEAPAPKPVKQALTSNLSEITAGNPHIMDYRQAARLISPAVG